ncbi:multicopper oxidase domain-containing protein [Flavobacterium sp. SUN046]|uniref:multicopper oxidase domain-containing protein n=1 Tax=Flavobacterium sp. SUN046 TaxID=3002440 RepID=UPI002DB81912|nr:multicopper oxidase domain-containing protein [Flavobacterium sp. SUN046]MEC4048570.1 multicopper oxidase domain-containing protein [Flavobacterium sp. SUN046]
MKIKLSIIIVLLTFAHIATAQDMKGMDMGKKEKLQIFYTCVMHPEIHSDKPGKCPKCGMVLIKEKAKTTKVVETKKETPVLNNEAQKTPVSHKAEPVTENKVKTISKTVRYDLYVRDTIVNFSGKEKRAIAVNGQIPMPTLTFTEGDIAEIYVHNELNEETSMHWHGLFLPNQYDGVPNLTQMPIKPHTTHLYTFPIIQHGTHWYHSHTGLQEQIGMYGSFIMNKKAEDTTFRKGIDDLPTVPIILSEWTDLKPENVHRMLHNATDWFAIKKGTTQSYAEAIKQGYFKTKIANEWKRMNAMDVSDVYYEKFLINGKNESQLSQFKAGDKVRLRISNGGASTYFWLTYAGGKITVVANDGNDVEPVEVDRLIVAVSETYDIIVTIPAEKTAYELLATPEDRTKSTSIYIGGGIKQLVSPLPKLKYFEGMKMMNGMMKMNGDLDDMGMQMSLNQMDMNVVMYPEITGETKKKTDDKMGNMKMTADDYNSNELSDITTLNYQMLKSPTKTNLPKDAPVKELHFELTGNMNRYVWSLDNKVVSETDKILIKKGENIRMILHNGSMMRHPMHLHGHDFRVLNGQGDYAPLKNIVDIMPMETDTIEFNANVEGDWFFHCHILYHMMSGMGRVFTYENQAANPEIPNPKLAQRKLFADDRKFHFMGENNFATNGNEGTAMIANTRWKVSTLWHLGYHDMHGYESETMIGRYLGKMQWLYPYIGYDYHYKMEGGPKNIFGSEEKTWFGQTSNKNNRHTLIAGIAYTLPMLFIADLRIDGDGKFRFQLGREDIPVSKRLRAMIMINTDKEYTTGLKYIFTRNLGITTHYDSDMGIGFGMNLNY